MSDTTKDDIEWMLDSMSDDGCKKIRQVKYLLVYTIGSFLDLTVTIKNGSR